MDMDDECKSSVDSDLPAETTPPETVFSDRTCAVVGE